MKARIDARFATAKETGDALGVPNSRVKRLVRLTSSTFRDKALTRWYSFKAEKETRSPENNHWALVRFQHKASKSKGKISSPKRKATKKSGASGKRHARGKVPKAAR